MFLGVLNNDERQAFAVLAERVIEADGIVVGAEKKALEVLKREIGIAEKGAVDGRSTEALASTFLGRRSKIAVLLELIGLGYSDASFSVDEKSCVARIAIAMGLGPEEMAELDQWVKEHVAHVQSALTMMHE